MKMSSTIIGPTQAARLFTARGKTVDAAMATATSKINAINADPYSSALQNSSATQPIPVPGGILFTCPYNIYVIPLDNVFNDQLYEGNGTTFWVQYATDNTVLAAVKFHSTDQPRMVLYPPLHLDGFPFQRFYISNLSAQAGKTIQIFTALDLNALNFPIAVG
jgi:hypothetical protein